MPVEDIIINKPPAQEGHTMSVASISEISSSSTRSFEDAVRKGVSKASETLRNIRSAWVKDQEVTVVDGSVNEYRVKLKISFEME